MDLMELKKVILVLDGIVRESFEDKEEIKKDILRDLKKIGVRNYEVEFSSVENEIDFSLDGVKFSILTEFGSDGFTRPISIEVE